MSGDQTCIPLSRGRCTSCSEIGLGSEVNSSLDLSTIKIFDRSIYIMMPETPKERTVPWIFEKVEAETYPDGIRRSLESS